MRKNFLLCAVLLAAMILSPLSAMEKTQAAETVSSVKKMNKNTVSIYMKDSDKIIETDEREYIIGVLAAETDMTCHKEALKAIAVAGYTYLRYTQAQENNEKFKGADISDDPDECQGYLDLNGRKEKWGDKFEEYEKLAGETADAVSGKTVTFNGEPILAVYHELNSGTTQSAQAVWGKDYQYLQAVESAGDRLSAEYSKTVMLNEEEFIEYAKKLEGVSLGDDEEKWAEITDINEDGYVRKVKVGNKEYSGSEFRDAFSLESCIFTVSYNDGRFKITTLGKGHLVGMSLYGADYMARQGSDYEQILTYYYQNTEIL